VSAGNQVWLLVYTEGVTVFALGTGQSRVASMPVQTDRVRNRWCFVEGGRMQLSQRFAGGSFQLGWTEVRGRPGPGAALCISGVITATGYSIGAAVLLMAKVSADAGGTPANLGSIASLAATLAYPRQRWSGQGNLVEDEFKVLITGVLPIESSVLEALEDLRQGRELMLQIESEVLMVDRGLASEGSVPDGPQPALDVAAVMGHIDHLRVSQEAWGRVLQDWDRGIGIPLIVPLVELMPSAERAEIVGHLRDAWRKVDGADYPGSLAASRKALELLRKISTAQGALPPPRERTVDQRIHAILSALHDLASASLHTDAPIKGFLPLRADAVAVVAATAALVQEVFARQRSA
jgi:hypothetical protein